MVFGKISPKKRTSVKERKMEKIIPILCQSITELKVIKDVSPIFTNVFPKTIAER